MKHHRKSKMWLITKHYVSQVSWRQQSIQTINVILNENFRLALLLTCKYHNNELFKKKLWQVKTITNQMSERYVTYSLQRHTLTTLLKTTSLSLKLTQKPPAGYWACASLHNPLVEKVAVVDFSVCSINVAVQDLRAPWILMVGWSWALSHANFCLVQKAEYVMLMIPEIHWQSF